MGHFDDCTLDDRFSSGDTHNFRYGDDRNGCLWIVWDFDQRRVIAVATAWMEDDQRFIYEALALHIDDLAADVVLIEVGNEGELIKCVSDIDKDKTRVPSYFPIQAYAGTPPFYHRRELVELDRMGVQVDQVVHKANLGDESRRLAFKYYFSPTNGALMWHEINCLMRIPPHPNIVPFDRLVVDSIDGRDVVVGYTTPFVPGGTLYHNPHRVFKLKHLTQLMDVVDILTLQLGIVHGDVVAYNLLIDADTDNLLLFDFNFASKLGWEGDPNCNDEFAYRPELNDVKLVTLSLYEIITRDMHFRGENEPEDLEISWITDMETWEKHPDVQLEADVSEYRHILDEWVVVRREEDKKMTNWTQAPRLIDWPLLPEFPQVDWLGKMEPRPYSPREHLVRTGRGHLHWQRPASCHLPLPKGRYLLATGQVVEEL